MSESVFCANCERFCDTETISQSETYHVRDRDITVTVDVERCCHCQAIIGSENSEEEVLASVYAAYRRELDLLTPDRIKTIRQNYRLSQKSFALLLGMSEATINRYEQGGLQDLAHDTAIRACEQSVVMRDMLNRRGGLLTAWQRKRVEQALVGQQESALDILNRLGEVNWVCMPREMTDKTGYRLFDYGRFACVVLWFCRQLSDVSRTTINKLLFYADFLNFRYSTLSLTGTAYRRAPFGPVPADYDGLLCRMESEGLLIREEREIGDYMGHYYRPGPESGEVFTDFNDGEQKVLGRIARTLGSLTAKQISERSHQERAWLDTAEGQFISYQLAERLSLVLEDEE